MKRFALLAVFTIALLVPACASPKKPAEAALAQAVTAWNAIKQQVLDVMPDEAPPIEGAIADATAKLSAGDYKGAVRYYEALEARYPFSELSRQARLAYT